MPTVAGRSTRYVICSEPSTSNTELKSEKTSTKKHELSHSYEWWQGYDYLGPRHRNPYKFDGEERRKAVDWLDGWQIRFYGEDP